MKICYTLSVDDEDRTPAEILELRATLNAMRNDLKKRWGRTRLTFSEFS